MAIISRSYTIEHYNYMMLGLRVLLKKSEGDDDKYFHQLFERMLKSMLMYSFITDNDVEDNKITGYVHAKLTEEEIETTNLAIYVSSENSLYGVEYIDYTNDLIQKNEEFQQKRREKKQRISNLYAEYLKSDLVNEKGKKTKVLFYKTYGYTADMLTSALKEFPID